MRLLLALGLLGIVACRPAAPRVLPTPEAELDRARREFRQGNFAKALLAYQRMVFEVGPNDSISPEVHYFLAESYFQTGDRVQAAHEFRQTADQFPSSPFAPSALLRAGDANLRLWRLPDLDPSYGEAALAIYQELAGLYPGSPAAARAQLHVRQLKEWFAEKVYKNGMFYFRRNAWDSAIIYFKDVIANYPETPRAADALLRLADSYRAIHYTEELRETCVHLQRYYPSHPGLARSCPAAETASPTPAATP
jgi:outer membrane protein assembly factor BamD